MKRLLTLLLTSLLLAACASAPKAPPSAHLFKDHLFKPPAEAIDVAQIFAVNDAMKRYAAQVMRNQKQKNPQVALFDALYKKDQLQLEYDSSITRNAAQTFTARRGNCLSLVIMTAALAREMNMTVQYQNVKVEETWSRSGGLYFSSGHVNLVLGKRIDDQRSYDQNKYMVVDFQPPADVERLASKLIDENTVIAMFMNNRAAESLVQFKLDDAYWSARKAIEYDPNFVHAYNTLGIIYQQHGNLPEAEATLRYAWQSQPANTIALSNLVQVLGNLGRTAEAAVLREKLARLEPNPPFHYFHLGQKAMQDGDYERARNLFAREVDRAPYYHEFHFWLASASFRLGDFKTADKHMKLALENSTTRTDHDLYAGKLDRLKSYGLKERKPAYSN